MPDPTSSPAAGGKEIGRSAASEVLAFLAARKWYWIVPLALIVLLLALLFALERDPMAPHVYPLF